jgi:parvulin-like peptidyl-prolyl isomerase
VVAQLQGVLTRAARLAAVALAAACAGPEPAPAKHPTTAPTPPVSDRPVVGPLPAPPVVPGLGPEILLPDAQHVDAEVARVGDLSLRQSHVYTRLLSLHPKLVLEAADLLVHDVLVARHAEQYGIRVSPERVEEVAAAEEKRVRQQVAAEYAGQMDFAGWVMRVSGMREADWQRTLRLTVAQRLYQGYVIRYLALREDRVQVRYIVHKDRQVLEDVAQKVHQGAAFATLALRLSDDSLRRDGGLLPPFGAGFPHPVTDVALTLQPGQLSALFSRKVGDSESWFLVYCLSRLPGRDVPFASVRDEIDAELAQKPLTPIETNAYTLRWRGGGEVTPPAGR